MAHSLTIPIFSPSIEYALCTIEPPSSSDSALQPSRQPDTIIFTTLNGGITTMVAKAQIFVSTVIRILTVRIRSMEISRTDLGACPLFLILSPFLSVFLVQFYPMLFLHHSLDLPSALPALGRNKKDSVQCNFLHCFSVFTSLGIDSVLIQF